MVGMAPDAVNLRPRLRVMFERSAGSYRYKPYPGRITLFTLAERNGMSDSLVDPALADIDPLLGWGGIAAEGVERHELCGEHVSILREPYVRALGEELRRCLDRARSPASPPQ
jgi:thioesterase domain-containing protein